MAPATILGIVFYTHIKILCVTFGTTIGNATKESWGSIVRVVQAQAQEACARNLCLAQRVLFVKLCLLAKIWYQSQILPLLPAHMQQLTTICTWCIWQGTTFRVPATKPQGPKEQGGWALPEIAVKCKTLPLSRIWILGARVGSVTEARIRQWQLTGTLANPPYENIIRIRIAYLKYYAIDIEYITPRGNTESLKSFKKRLYATLYAMNTVTREIPNLCIPKNTHPSHGRGYGATYTKPRYPNA